METIDIAKLVGSIKSLDTWVVLIIVSIFGMLGGLAHKLTSPPKNKTSLPGYLVVGAVASLAVLFVFAPSDPVRLIALSLAAGYGGKAVLDALEARVKTALAEAETDKAKEEGKKAVEAGKEAISHAQKLSRINKELEKSLMKATQQPRETILETLKAPLPTDLHSFVTKSSEAVTDELKQLSNKLDFLRESFQK
jgi:hypothetical protein